MRFRLTLAAWLLTTGLVHAQAVSPLGGSTNNAGSPPPALAAPAPTTAARPTARAHRTMADRFTAANTAHDGKLTLDQAKAGHLRAIARDFAEIDKSKRGYVTLDDIKAHQSQQRAARKANKPSQ